MEQQPCSAKRIFFGAENMKMDKLKQGKGNSKYGDGPHSHDKLF